MHQPTTWCQISTRNMHLTVSKWTLGSLWAGRGQDWRQSKSVKSHKGERKWGKGKERWAQ